MITINEAIEILTDIADECRNAAHASNAAALDLGIEALKRVKHIRDTYQKNSWVGLPGETNK